MESTYSPEDNKLRLYPDERLSKEDYEKVRSMGFIWAPKQKLFVAPMWTPSREDFLIEFTGEEIGDEDTSLVERQEERAARFENYSEKREAEAEQVKNSVDSICKHIPFGQPILIGHHSEKRARKDAERIENGMRKAVKLWETSEYWTMRAAGALHHAKYKELPRVRANRIKRIEADKRKRERARKEAEKLIKFWQRDIITEENRPLIHEILGTMQSSGVMLRGISGECWYSAWEITAPDEERYSNYPIKSIEELQEIALRLQNNQIIHCDRWINHYKNRIAYETAMLNEQGAGDLIKPKARPKQLPICNYRTESISVKNRWNNNPEILPQIEMTKDEYMKQHEDRRYTVTIDNSHRVRVVRLRKTGGEYFRTDTFCVFLTDSKVHEKPEPIEKKKIETVPELKDNQVLLPREKTEKEIEFQNLKKTLKEGIQVVSAPQLFPTPKEVAALMVSYLEVEDQSTILEPSAGSGSLLNALDELAPISGDITAIEINYNLAEHLKTNFPLVNVVCDDFLSIQPAREGNCSLILKDLPLAFYDRVIMNPPFKNGEDIKHIQHALKFLHRGGVLVALCADGPRQKTALEPLAELWEPLPAGSFKEQGTNVNVVLMVIRN